MLFVQAAFYYSGSDKDVIPPIERWNQFPTELGGWQSDGDLPMDQAILIALQPDDFLARNYSSAQDPHIASLFVGYFNSRRNGRAPHSPEWCLPGAGWKSIFSKPTTISFGKEQMEATEYLIQKGSSKELVLYWYHQGSRTVSSDLQAQFYSLPDLILHRRTDIALVRVIVAVDDKGLENAEASGFNFVRTFYPAIRKHIG